MLTEKYSFIDSFNDPLYKLVNFLQFKLYFKYVDVISMLLSVENIETCSPLKLSKLCSLFTIENLPDPQNPKTSKLAILSAIETLRQYCSDDIQIGT